MVGPTASRGTGSSSAIRVQETSVRYSRRLAVVRSKRSPATRPCQARPRPARQIQVLAQCIEKRGAGVEAKPVEMAGPLGRVHSRP